MAGLQAFSTGLLAGTGLRTTTGLGNAGLQIVSAFNPASLFAGGVQGFVWDISNTSTLWQERTGPSATTPATATTNPVGSVADLSGNGNWFTVPTADGKRPLLDITTGLYALAFDGVDDEINSAVAALFSLFDDKDFYIGVATSNMAAGAERNIFADRADVTIGIFASQGELMSLRYSSFFSVGATQAAQVAAANVWSWNTSSATMVGRRSGVQQGTSVSITGTQAGTQAYVGSRGGSQFTAMKLYAMVACGRSLSASELAATETWLGARAGLTL